MDQPLASWAGVSVSPDDVAVRVLQPVSGGRRSTKLMRSLYSGRVAQELRAAIIDGRLPAGAALVEMRLAEELAVSRGPIRSALNALEAEGLVDTLPNGRTVSAGFAKNDLDDLYSVRYELEALAITWGIEAKADTAPIRAAFDSLVDDHRVAPHVVDMDMAIHRAIVEFSGSRFLVQAWQAIAPVIHAVILIGTRNMMIAHPTENFSRIVAHHEPLVQAIESGRAVAARELLAGQFAFSKTNLRIDQDLIREAAARPEE